MKTKALVTLFALALLAAFTLPAVAQVETFSDTLKPNTTAQFIVDWIDPDSAHADLSFPDSASGRVRYTALADINGTLIPLTTDTAMVKWFGPNAGASNVRISWMAMKDTTYCNECGAKLPRWHVFPTKFLIEVIFFNDAASYGGYADQAVKYFTLTFTKYRRLPFGSYPIQHSIDTLKRSTTMTCVVDMADCDSIQAVISYPDSAQGRVRLKALAVVNGEATELAADTIMLKKIDGKNVGGGQTRISWAQMKGIAPTGGGAPRWVEIELLFDATVTASGVAPPDYAQIDVRKYRHK
jgi:hypothetical protein